MRRFRAAVLFPWDPTLMAFYELYRLGTPLLLPRSGWIFKVQHFTGWIWAQPLGALQFAHLAPETAPSPWWRPEDSEPQTVLHWYAFSDCRRLPHLLRFGSFAELFELLLDSPQLRKARRGMRLPGRVAGLSRVSLAICYIHINIINNWIGHREIYKCKYTYPIIWYFGSLAVGLRVNADRGVTTRRHCSAGCAGTATRCYGSWRKSQGRRHVEARHFFDGSRMPQPALQGI